VLPRIAGNLYWIGRYVERADFLALLLDATLRLSALPTTHGGDPTAWPGALAVAGVAEAFAATHGEPGEVAVAHYLAVEASNPSAISNCIERARRNARTANAGLTREACEVLNAAWRDVQRLGAQEFSKSTVYEFTEAVQRAVALFDGVTQRTMLRDDAYRFLQLGAAVERADNTARLLDVKYHMLLPGDEPVGGDLDHFQWSTILRTVSALAAYRRIYHEAVKPWLVADLLIFNDRMPRSLTCCYETIVELLDHLGAGGGRRGPAHLQASRVQQQLRKEDIKTLFSSGLHEFLVSFVSDNNQLGGAIAEQFGFAH
jgi:uncharacterized alpha-E superfamily protein